MRARSSRPRSRSAKRSSLRRCCSSRSNAAPSVWSARMPSARRMRSSSACLAAASSWRWWGLMPPPAPVGAGAAARRRWRRASTCFSTSSGATPSSSSETWSSKHCASTLRLRSWSRMPWSGARWANELLKSGAASRWFWRGRMLVWGRVVVSALSSEIRVVAVGGVRRTLSGLPGCGRRCQSREGWRGQCCCLAGCGSV